MHESISSDSSMCAYSRPSHIQPSHIRLLRLSGLNSPGRHAGFTVAVVIASGGSSSAHLLPATGQTESEWPLHTSCPVSLASQPLREKNQKGLVTSTYTFGDFMGNNTPRVLLMDACGCALSAKLCACQSQICIMIAYRMHAKFR